MNKKIYILKIIFIFYLKAMNSDLQLVENVLQGLMTPNNEERKKAELQLAELMQKNTIGLVLYLSQIINQNADNSILTYSSVVMRKLIQVKENETVNVHWKNANNEMKEEIKKNVLNALLNCNDKSLKKNMVILLQIYVKIYIIMEKNGIIF